MNTGRIYLPAKGPEDWQQLLASPETHWESGYSARTLAHAWHSADGFPPEVSTALATCPALSGVELLLGLPEHKVPLPGGKTASQTDLWVLARTNSGLASIAVEGKVNEPFGPTINEWLQDASPGKQERLTYLLDQLGLSDPPGQLRYQLLHRTASAVIEARRFGARHAVLLVHSFSPEMRWFEDFAAFVGLYGARADDGVVATVHQLDGCAVHCGWVTGDPALLDR